MGGKFLLIIFDYVSFISDFTSHISELQRTAGKEWHEYLDSVNYLLVQRPFWYAGREVGGAWMGTTVPSILFILEKCWLKLQWVLKTASRLQTPWVLKEPEFPSSVLFRFSFGFLLGSWGVSLLRVRRRYDLSFLNRVEFSQNWLEFVFLLLKIQLHTRKEREWRI